ncbi:TPA: DUF1372 family protein [Streptococcus suis]|nr:DUF1372 family protein [Streptococcus suis]
MKETVKFAASLIIVLLAAAGMTYMIYQIGFQTAKNERQPVIIYTVDNTGTEMFGRVTSKDVVDGRYYVEIGAYGKFLVTKGQFEMINIGDDIPDYLQGRGS